MNLTSQFVSDEIEYLDPELHNDPEFNRIRKRSHGPGIVTKTLFAIIYLSFAADAATLIWAYFYCRLAP